MPSIKNNAINIHYKEDGDSDGTPLVFANSLGTNLHLWDNIIPFLPSKFRIIRFDKRGHGKSDVPDPPYKMGALISDAEALLDRLEIKSSIFIGLSIGGMIGQGLATKRPDLITALILSNTAAKMGTAEMWTDRSNKIKNHGIESIADSVMERWFSQNFLSSESLPEWRKMLVETPESGYIGCCDAISGTDLFTTTSSLSLPTLAIAGSEDGASPPDLVRETQQLIKGSHFKLIKGAGHLPCVEKPEEYAFILKKFLADCGF
jgi:3-oxoadipate enol-lactonase